MIWIVASDAQLAQYFERENVWSKTWTPVIGDNVIVVDRSGEELTLSLWEATFKGKRKLFAAAEVSNSVWVFALPQS